MPLESTNFHFAYPWALVLCMIPLFSLFKKQGQRSVFYYPDATVLESIPSSLRLQLRRPVLALFSILAATLLGIAAARPQRVTPVASPQEARNLMLAIDVSQSMSAQDFGGIYGRATRLAAVKSVVSKFIEARSGDRLGLVVFGDKAFLQAPLTLDNNLVKEMVSRLGVGVAGNGTAIGEGLGLALKRIAELPGESRAIILLTDGVNNSGAVDPIKAAQVAQQLGVKVHTIGVGRLGQVAGMVQAEFDEKTLREVAQLTGGLYFNAQDIAGLEEVYQEIDKLESSKTEQETLERVDELFPQFAIWGLFTYLIFLCLSRTVFLKVP